MCLLQTIFFSNFSKVLLKKELCLSTLTVFDDRPEYYSVWKSAFKQVVTELGFSPSEEINLLIKYLGSNSRQHAISIKAANMSNPRLGVKRIWERLDDRFASPELVESLLKKKLANFPKINQKEPAKLFDLHDIVSEIESLKGESQHSQLLSYFDTSAGVSPIVSKLPYNLQEKWISCASDYKRKYHVSFPPFSVFAKFLRSVAKLRNDPSFFHDNPPQKESTVPASKVKSAPGKSVQQATVKKTEAEAQDPPKSMEKKYYCPYHNSDQHSLNYCRNFRFLPLSDRKMFLAHHKICSKCCRTNEHAADQCKVSIKCGLCKQTTHAAALHVFSLNANSVVTHRPDQSVSKSVNTNLVSTPSSQHGGEQSVVTSSCTQICNNVYASKSCAKILLVSVFRTSQPDSKLRCYIILDDQSNCSLGSSKLFDFFNEKGPVYDYSLLSCAGRTQLSGRRATGFSVQSLDGQRTIDIPLLIECNDIPSNRDEIPAPDIIRQHPHLVDIASLIPQIDPEADILLLIGRDCPSAHHVFSQCVGPVNGPFAQETSLGWTVIGDVCLNGAHLPSQVSVLKTSFLHDGRPSLLEPCDNSFKLIEMGNEDSIFLKTKRDDKRGLSVEDREFLRLMNQEFRRDFNGRWVAPLPFSDNKSLLKNNRAYVLNRMRSLDKCLRKQPEKRAQMVEFMENIFECGHAEVAPVLASDDKCWYLPLFGIYHPKKPDRIRVVFDSSAQYNNVSLNDVLMSGPDFTNSLLGVLMRFRREAIAISADVEQMFYNFQVTENHRDFLRFFWYRDNNPDLELIEYRMTVHVFGNTPSPAIATYGMRKSVENADSDVQDFVNHDFYVDDGLISVHNDEVATDLIRRTQAALFDGGKLRLHKVASNSRNVLASLPPDDLAKGLKDINLVKDLAPLQNSLGLIWDINTDTFMYKFSGAEKPLTRRGVLSIVNSLYDPLGFLAPVIIQGKLFLREVNDLNYGWDDPLSTDLSDRWLLWKDTLSNLNTVTFPRMYSSVSLSQAHRIELHMFCDASKEAIGAVAYLKVFDTDYSSGKVCFLLGKAKVAPQHGHTIPRLELCAAVLAADIYDIILEHLHIDFDTVQFYTDSQVVLGYINNEKRRFYVYVSNRVDRIRRSTFPSQWTYVSSECNPADQATRGVLMSDIQNSVWINGPGFLQEPEHGSTCSQVQEFPLINADYDENVRPLVNVNMTNLSPARSSIVERFSKFSSWKTLLKAVSLLRHLVRSFKKDSVYCKGWHMCHKSKTVDSLKQAEFFVVSQVQQECFSKEIQCLKNNSSLPTSSPLIPLSPFLDDEGILRVGGRLSKLERVHGFSQVHPIIVPKKHHVAILLVRHFHQSVEHQGRHLTEGAVRKAGFWIVGARRIVSSIIFHCVTCRRVRGQGIVQKMGNLPSDRLNPNPPFTFVGVDVFGPWQVVTRHTRGDSANSKRWAVIFACLVSRAVHIEVIEELSASSFINALRRFISLRGPVKLIRSDRGTNFVGAVNELGIHTLMDEDGPVHNFLLDQGCTWIFNPPFSSHMGGSWERLIGIARRILDVMFSNHHTKRLTHEVLVTFMAEVCAIINSRPIVPVSTDPDDPLILSPSLLLTQKVPTAEYSFSDIDIRDAYKSNWKNVQLFSENFWSKWRKEYLHHLQQRRKWANSTPNLKVGDIVLLKDSNIPRYHWPLGKITRVFPGDDGLVRKVEVLTTRDGVKSLYVRPVKEVILLV